MPLGYLSKRGHMDHPHNPGGNASIGRRLRLIRTEFWGENGGAALAGQLGLPFRTWVNYESGVRIPGEILLSFLVATSTNPLWLLRGVGPKYTQRRLETSTDVGAN
jgi:hypothetical protein